MLVAAVAGGVVAGVTFLLAREYRWHNLRTQAEDEARIALALAPPALDQMGFERLRALYEPRSEADLVAVRNGRVFSSSPGLDRSDIPRGLAPARGTPPVRTETRVDGRSTLVVGAQGPGGTDYFLFFSLEQLEESLDELARVALAAWAVAVAAAGLVGQIVARETLRPVAEVAGAARAIAGGDLATRLPPAGADEFGLLAAAFNHMADEVEDLVHKLTDAADRERRFTADVAHDLRTPLTGMSAAASVLAEMTDELPPPARSAAAILVGDVGRFRDLVTELLELARLDAGEDSVQVEPLSVAEAVAAVARSTAVRRAAALDVDACADDVVWAEPARLRRIIGNLLDNALTHGRPPVRFVVRRAGPTIIIEVADDGPGVPDAELPRLFDRFYKRDAARSSTGSGLGLAIAREHARAQSGDLVAVNQAGRGTVFVLSLPAASADEGDHEPQQGDGDEHPHHVGQHAPRRGRTAGDPVPGTEPGRAPPAVPPPVAQRSEDEQEDEGEPQHEPHTSGGTQSG